ncbi:hypothetical protein LJC08_03490 [Methanimicrococcus sp. OttesenSCG-928-J09]|nr:hypothetical protein [Methanimicrococcus sp. OttesenSCG-928-J09]
MYLPNAKLITDGRVVFVTGWSQVFVTGWSQVFVTGWSQVSVLQWEGGLHFKIADAIFSGSAAVTILSLSAGTARASRTNFQKINKKVIRFSKK